MRTPSRGRLPGLLFALSVAAACNLSELSKVTFDLPPKTYSFNTSSWSLPPVPPAAIPCADATTCCIPGVIDCAAATPATILCAEGVCAVDIPITVPQRVILGRESPTLSNVTGVVNITIERIGYDVLNNTLNIDLPQLDLYLAPDGVMDISDPSVRKFGTVPPIPARHHDRRRGRAAGPGRRPQLRDVHLEPPHPVQLHRARDRPLRVGGSRAERRPRHQDHRHDVGLALMGTAR